MGLAAKDSSGLLLKQPGGQGAWASEARAAARARFDSMGAPSKRDEYWKFTDPAPLQYDQAPHAAVFDPNEEPLFNAVDRLKIVFRDGAFDAEASDALALEHVELQMLDEVAKADLHWAKDLYGA